MNRILAEEDEFLYLVNFGINMNLNSSNEIVIIPLQYIELNGSVGITSYHFWCLIMCAPFGLLALRLD